jgi:hypothetical protein
MMQTTQTQTKLCQVPGCRGKAIGRTMCGMCTRLITRKERMRFKAAIGGANKLRYYQQVLLPLIGRRHQRRGEN